MTGRIGLLHGHTPLPAPALLRPLPTALSPPLRRPMPNPSTAPASERGQLVPWPLAGGHVCRWHLVNRELSEHPGLCQSGSPLGGGDGKLSYPTLSVKRGLGVWTATLFCGARILLCSPAAEAEGVGED